jgi:CO/xanthine dehydrogenase FAD-binding subunit
MKPAPFDYYDPRSLDEALVLLGRHGQEARALAGGQSLVPRLNLRITTPAVLVDLNRIPDLAYVEQTNGVIRFGAMARQRQIQFSDLVSAKLPLLGEAIRFVGHLPTRSRGTIGGSLAFADPAAELPAVVTALDGDLVVRGQSGERTLKPAEFFVGPFRTALAADELLVEVRLPATPERSGAAFAEVSLRENHFALVGVAAQLTIDAAGRCTTARLGVGGCPTPRRLRAVEEILERHGVGESVVAAAADRAAELVDPLEDVHASSAYRRRLTRTLVSRALTSAAARARGVESDRG